MALDEAFECVAEVVPGELKRFQKHIDPVWIEEALEATALLSAQAAAVVAGGRAREP